MSHIIRAEVFTQCGQHALTPGPREGTAFETSFYRGETGPPGWALIPQRRSGVSHGNTDPDKVKCRWRQRWEPQDGTPQELGGVSRHSVSGARTPAQTEGPSSFNKYSSPRNSRPPSPLPPSYGPRGTDSPGLHSPGPRPVGGTAQGHLERRWRGHNHLQGASLVTNVLEPPVPLPSRG